MKRPDSIWKCSEDSKKVLNMSLSQTVAELGLIIKGVLYLFFRLFVASSIQEGLIFNKYLNWINKKGKNRQKIDKITQFEIFFQNNQALNPSHWIILSRFHMEMFWGFQKGIIHVSITNGCGVRSYNQEGLIIHS